MIIRRATHLPRMQRRVAAIYFAFFVIVGAGAYSVMAVADAPQISVEGETYQQGDTITAGGQTYTFSAVETTVEEGGGGHGSGGGASVSHEAELSWTNESARFTATLANGTNISYQGSTYQVQIPNATDPARFTLREQQDPVAIVTADDAVYDEIVTINGTKYVTYRSNNTNVPLSEYLPEPDSERVNEGDSLAYQNETTTVANVTSSSVLLTWTGPRENTMTFAEGENVTVGGTQYVATFPSNSTVKLSTQVAEYQNQLRAQHYFTERMNGLWGIIIISGIAAMLVIALAYMPFRG